MHLKIRPFFYYYGGKFRMAPHYPTPIHETIVEPFAGAAGYSTRYYWKRVLLYEANPLIVGLWNYLITVKEQEIRKLPLKVDWIPDLKIPQEAKWLIAFFCNHAGTTPKNQPSSWMKAGLRPNSHWGAAVRERIATQLSYIRHWKIEEKDYADIDNIRATWFIDPPYDCKAGRLYPFQVNDFKKLATYCRVRKGQVIVCEKEGAKWLPFKFLHKLKTNSGSRGKTHSHEAVYLQEDLVCP